MATQDPPGARVWHVYVLACGDGTLYTGIAVDVEARLAAHRDGRGARYTRGRGPLRLLRAEAQAGRGAALRLEAWLKAQPRARKLAWARGELAPAI